MRGLPPEIAAQAQPVAGYRVIDELGTGAMGIVALAIRIADGLPVALKTVTPAMAVHAHQLNRFLREAKILSQLRHPNIVAYQDMGGTDEQLWFAMDYVRGADACQLLRQEGPLPIGRAVRLISQLLDALVQRTVESLCTATSSHRTFWLSGLAERNG